MIMKLTNQPSKESHFIKIYCCWLFEINFICSDMLMRRKLIQEYKIIRDDDHDQPSKLSNQKALWDKWGRRPRVAGIRGYPLILSI